jgi:hypothetical protein
MAVRLDVDALCPALTQNLAGIVSSGNDRFPWTPVIRKNFITPLDTILPT